MVTSTAKTESTFFPPFSAKTAWPKRLARAVLLPIALIAGTGLLSSGAAHAQRSSDTYPAVVEAPSVAGGVARINVLGDPFAQGAPVVSSQSRIVLYRPDDGRPGATSVFVDDRYHTSLVPGAWSQLCYNSGPAEVGARQMEAVTRAAKDRYDAISALNLQPGQTHYLRVSDINGRPVLRPMASTQALQEISATREQQHTVSRVAQLCKEGPPLTPQVYTLAADTLFEFDRSERAAMTDAGTRAIDLLLSRLQSEYSRIDRMHLIGHADPLGKPERNEVLGIERAQTVREYILRTGLVQAPITTEGRSSREPVVRHCGPYATPQAIACNLPNRRVAVEVVGIRR